MPSKPYVDTPQEAALRVLCGLDAATWRTLAELAQRQQAGRLSKDAWQTATDSLLELAAQRISEWAQ